MSNNPLAGISIPSLQDIADKVVDRFGTNTLDLSNPLQRKRLKDYISLYLGQAITFELERALHAASDKAITHVFKVMRDAEYQEKKRKYSAHRKEQQAIAKQKRKAVEAKARMDYSRRKMILEKGTIQ